MKRSLADINSGLIENYDFDVIYKMIKNVIEVRNFYTRLEVFYAIVLTQFCMRFSNAVRLKNVLNRHTFSARNSS